MYKVDVTKLGNATVIVDIVAKGNFEIRPGYYMDATEIAVHNTGNTGRGADAEAHNRYIHNMAELPASATGYASWHFSVDDKFIYQHLPLSESAWHTGDGNFLFSGNRVAIGIEICENPETDTAQAEENALALIAYLVDVLNINVQRVKPHKAYSGKYCPRVILTRDGGFSKFHARVVEACTPPVVETAVASTSITKFSPSRVGRITGSVYSQEQPSFSADRRVKVLEEGNAYKVYAESNGYYNVGSDEWVSKNYMELIQLIGEATTDIWTQKDAFYSSTGRVKILAKGSRWKVYGEKNGYYSLGSEWCSTNYMKLV